MESNCFSHVLHKKDNYVVFVLKRIEIVQLPHALYTKNVQEMYLENIAQIFLPRNVWYNVFHTFSTMFQCNFHVETT
jgi:hypothetical protein